MRRLLPFLWILALNVPLASSAAPACPQPLRIGFLDTAVPPGLLGQGTAFADPPGWEVTAVRESLRKLGCTAELVRLPNRRLAASLAQDRVEFALLYAVTPERLQAMRFPLDAQGRPDPAWAPAFGHLALFSTAGSLPDPGWDGRTLPPGTRVGVLAGSVQETLAHERGWAMAPISQADASAALGMLQARRFDLLLALRDTMPPEQRNALVEWAPPVARLPYYMTASPQVGRKHPAWTRTFWREVCHAVRRLDPDMRPVDCGVVPGPIGR